LPRRWRDADGDAFAELNADREAMEHFPEPLTREESEAFIDHIEVAFEEHGFGICPAPFLAFRQALTCLCHLGSFRMAGEVVKA